MFGLVPIVLYCFVSNTGGETSYAEVLSLYGYSFVYFVPGSFLCLYPSFLLKWVALGGAMGCSLLFLARNMWEEVKVFVGVRRYLVFGLTLGSHAVFVTVCSLYLYN
jgi:hypothetical protein